MIGQIALPPALLTPLAGWFVLVNLLTLMLFALRRAQSGTGEWQGAETRTLLLATFGGWLGAKIGQLVFRQPAQSRGFGVVLNLSVLVLPVILAAPVLIQRAPGWIGAGVAAYSAQYADQPGQEDKVSPLGAAYRKADRAAVAKDGADSPDATGAAATADQAAQPVEKVLPRRFGPVSDGRGASKGAQKSKGAKTLTVGN
jgi:uncharacterized membrane protein YsdA (DUF1294 family)